MNICHILPVKNVVNLPARSPLLGQYSMCLTHLVNAYPGYANTYKRFSERDYTKIILDNSLIENDGRALDIHKVLKAAEAVNAYEIILPDVFLSRDGTLKAVEDALPKVENSGYKLMAVAHGKTIAEFADCFTELSHIQEIDTIGIPKIMTNILAGGRPSLESIWIHSNKNIHLLGVYYSFTELKEFLYPDRIRSVDSCQLAWIASTHRSIEATRPGGFTMDLEKDYVSYDDLKYYSRLLYDYMKR